jgi:hypothetical protein
MVQFTFQLAVDSWQLTVFDEKGKILLQLLFNIRSKNLPTANCQLPTVNCQPSTVNRQPSSVIGHRKCLSLYPL